MLNILLINYFWQVLEQVETQRDSYLLIYIYCIKYQIEDLKCKF